jgi:hypothetical protein
MSVIKFSEPDHFNGDQPIFGTIVAFQGVSTIGSEDLRQYR